MVSQVGFENLSLGNSYCGMTLQKGDMLSNGHAGDGCYQAGAG